MLFKIIVSTFLIFDLIVNFMKTVKLGTMNGIDAMARFFSWFLVISAIYLIWN